MYVCHWAQVAVQSRDRRAGSGLVSLHRRIAIEVRPAIPLFTVQPPYTETLAEECLGRPSYHCDQGIDDILERFRLRAQLLSRGGILFRVSRVGLHGLFDLRYRPDNLFYSPGLFLATLANSIDLRSRLGSDSR
jgi:hypothetical protein